MPRDDVKDLYQKYFPIIRAKCSRMLGNSQEAEEVAQESFLRLLNQRPKKDETRQTVAWIYRTSTNLSVDRLRQRARSDGYSEEQDHYSGSISSGAERRMEVRSQLRALAKTSSSKKLAAIILHRIDGLSQADVASVMDCSERTVRRLLSDFDTENLILKRGI